MFSPGTILREKYESFKALLEYDKLAHELMADLEEIYYNQKKYDFQTIIVTYDRFADAVFNMVESLLKMSPSNYWDLKSYFKKFDFYIRFMLAPPEFEFSPPFTIAFDKISSHNEAVSGKKAFSLSCLNQELFLPTPDGFVITTNAFHYFIEANDLQKPINLKLAGLDIGNPTSLEQTAREIEQFILNAVIPEDIDAAITDAVNSLERCNEKTFRLALRSSAVKEDGKASFAGQYQTLLNVDKTNVLQGYKRVIAGKYSARALFYRVSHGILDQETAMAVLALEMIDSKTSGVMYTRNIENPVSENLQIHSVWGQGELLVEGEVPPDVIEVSRKNPEKIVRIKIAAQKTQMVISSTHQTRKIDTSRDKANRLSIDKASVLTLARWGTLLETHFNQPQDIEWCQDKSGRLFVLQSRPLNIDSAEIQKDKTQSRAIENKIVCSKGETVSAGAGSGPIFKLEHLSQIPLIPDGSVLVVNHAVPEFVTAIDKVNAIIIGFGSQASHFSSIAREFGVPTIVNIHNGFHDLVQGNRVTVDAGQGIVYKGTVRSLMKKTMPREDFFSKSSFMVKLRYVINFASKLKLTDPESESFAPEGCRSLHDIIRFAHESAVKEMFFIGNRKGSRKKGAKKLISSIPMLFYVLDVGQGIKADRINEKTLKPEDIASIPMTAVLKGLSNPGICWSETTHFDWEEYDRIVMAGGIISADSVQFGSYAVISKDYLNANIRFGYHFVILDTICSSSKEDNYILFRFSGGGGDTVGRSVRANFIKGILEKLGFMVTVKSDLVDAEFKHGSLNTMKETLDFIGRLLGATKLMDMYLKENMDIEFLIDAFMNGRYDFRPDAKDLQGL